MKKYLQKLFEDAAKRLPFLSEIELLFDTPKIETHGDLSSNAAMILSKKLKKNPRELAAEILANLDIDKNIISKTEIAGPGFINFYFTPSFISEIIKEINERGDSFGKSKKYSGKRANVEFVSANPTGPLTVGHGRGAVTGDTIANMLEWIGYTVDREYYFNNAGRQMRVLGNSVKLRYNELLNEINDFEKFISHKFALIMTKTIKEKFRKTFPIKISKTRERYICDKITFYFESYLNEIINRQLQDIIIDRFININRISQKARSKKINLVQIDDISSAIVKEYINKLLKIQNIEENLVEIKNILKIRNQKFEEFVRSEISHLIDNKVYEHYYDEFKRFFEKKTLKGKNKFPEDYYQGPYISASAAAIYKEFGDELIDESAEGKFKEATEAEIFNDIKKSLSRIGVYHKIFFNEKSLYEDGKIDDLLKKFKSSGLSYEKDGAIWLKLSELTGGEDKVIVKATGEPTYRLPDIAYHAVKYNRGYDLMIDLFGSDHNATYPDVLAGIKALGYDVSKVKVLIHQFVTILKDGEVVKMSTRKANYITLDELIDEVGSDVVRYFFNMRTISSHMNFDIDLAKKQSDENPVFYLQYAHARICSIIRTVESENLKPATDNINLLVEEEEQGLLKKLYKFEEEVLYSAENYEPQKICAYLEDLAASFHKFYTFRRILGSEKNIAGARLALAVATKTVIKNGLTILGVSAPERM